MSTTRQVLSWDVPKGPLQVFSLELLCVQHPNQEYRAQSHSEWDELQEELSTQGNICSSI